MFLNQQRNRLDNVKPKWSQVPQWTPWNLNLTSIPLPLPLLILLLLLHLFTSSTSPLFLVSDHRSTERGDDRVTLPVLDAVLTASGHNFRLFRHSKLISTIAHSGSHCESVRLYPSFVDWKQQANINIVHWAVNPFLDRSRSSRSPSYPFFSNSNYALGQ